MKPSIVLFAISLAACSEANHIGNPLLLPVYGLQTAVENAQYDAKRQRIKTWIAQHQQELRAEAFQGPVTDRLLAVVAPENRERVRADLREISVDADFVEQATIIVMVHR